MANGIDGIDHAVVAVADLEIAKARYIRLGFTVTPRRRMVGWGTANYSVMFDDKDFIELLGVVDSSAFLTPGLADFLVGGEGAMAVTLRANDVTSAHAALSTLGANPTPLNEVTINCEAPWGDLPQSFRWLKIGEAATPDMYLMLVQPLTPQNMRRPEWVEHANGARSIRAMTIVVSDPDALRPAYERLLGGQARAIAGGFEIFTGHGDFRFITQAALGTRYGDAAQAVAHPAPTIAALTLGTADLTAAQRCFDEAGATYTRQGDGIRLAAAEACGAILEFVPG